MNTFLKTIILGILVFGFIWLNSRMHNENKKHKQNDITNIDSMSNNFSNLGFILNPNYAKKHDIDSNIVNYKFSVCKNYIDKYKNVAINEMKSSGIPASISLSLGLIQSNAGQSELARNNNNHFGIKCLRNKCKTGHCTNTLKELHKVFFINYEKPNDSYQAHTYFLKKKRYEKLFNLKTNDYKKWSGGLYKAGYTTDPHYEHKINMIIEKYNLIQLDY